MNTKLAQSNMIEQQIRTWKVLDQNVLSLIGSLNREYFIPSEYKSLAFADTQIPIGNGQFTLTPKFEARAIQSLEIKKTDKVLEIGTGCAYTTALLAHAAEQVASIDLYKTFTDTAKQKLMAISIENVTLQTGDVFCQDTFANLNATKRQFDVILITGSIPNPKHLQILDYLALGGRMFLVAGKDPIMEAKLLRLKTEGHCVTESLFETNIPALVGTSDDTNKFRF